MKRIKSASQAIIGFVALIICQNVFATPPYTLTFTLANTTPYNLNYAQQPSPTAGSCVLANKLTLQCITDNEGNLAVTGLFTLGGDQVILNVSSKPIYNNQNFSVVSQSPKITTSIPNPTWNDASDYVGTINFVS